MSKISQKHNFNIFCTAGKTCLFGTKYLIKMVSIQQRGCLLKKSVSQNGTALIDSIDLKHTLQNKACENSWMNWMNANTSSISYCRCGRQASTNWFCACQIMALNCPFQNVPAIFNVFSNFGTMCLLDNLADSAICGGLSILL